MPCHHNSDHCAVVAEIYSGAEKKLKAYQRRFSKFPIRLPQGPQGELETQFEEFCLDVAPLPKNQWISDSTWVLIDQGAALRQAGKLNQCRAHVIGRCIKAALKGDRKQRAATVGDKIKGLLATGEVKEAWCCLKGWCTAVEDRVPKACHETLARQTEERKTLYARVPPPGEQLPINVTPFDVPDGVPSNLEIREVVRELQNGRAAGATGLQAEHIKVWLQDVVQEEAETAPAGHEEIWQIFLWLIQAIWERGCVPDQMTWEIIVLLPKGGEDYHGIGLLEPFWKVVEKIMVRQLSSIKFHDCLHGGLPKWGTGTASIEVKLAQQLAWRDQCLSMPPLQDLSRPQEGI
jgi:hypothetical protein